MAVYRGRSTWTLDDTMRAMYLATSIALLLVSASGANANVCKVPGTTLKWVAARCMLELDTSDTTSPSVVECVKRSGAYPQACELNISYKQAYCELLVSKGRYKGSIELCVADAGVTT